MAAHPTSGQRPDPWRHVSESGAVPVEGDVTVPLDVWQSHRDALSWRDGRTGVRLGPADRVEALRPGIERLSLVVLEAAGDDASEARRERSLRDALGYEGEIRRGPAPPLRRSPARVAAGPSRTRGATPAAPGRPSRPVAARVTSPRP